MSSLPPVSLLRRGALAIPEGASASKTQELKNSIPIDYILSTIKNTPVVNAGSKVFILRAGTGSGKSTTFPTQLYKMGNARTIAITEPRRLTAEEIPADICDFDKSFKMGENIGYKTGLIEKKPRQGILFITVGSMLGQLGAMLPDAFMKRYSAVIVDEVHTHDNDTDGLLNALKIFLKKHWNNPMCPIVVVQSATLNPDKYKRYFGTTNFVDVGGITFPINAHWPDAAVGNVQQYVVDMCKTLTGDILIFCPTGGSIKAMATAIKDAESKTTVIEIMGKTIGKGEVKQMMYQSDQKRVVIATNAAETGLTLSYLKHIIDTGVVNSVCYNPQYACTTVVLQPVTRSSAMQRRGRVGRKAVGDWYPVYTQETFDAMVVDNSPEIYTKDISLFLLKAIILATDSSIVAGRVESQLAFDPATIDLIHSPSGENMVATYDKLYQLGMIHANWLPTVTGVLTNKFSKISIESCKMLFSHSYYKADLYKLVIIAACTAKNMGDLKTCTENLYDDVVCCGYIRTLLVFEYLQRQILRMKNSTRSVSEWCTAQGIDYDACMEIIEDVYTLIFGLMSVGIAVDMHGVPMLHTLEGGNPQSINHEISTIKQCIYEGYRMNSATWNETRQSYTCNYKHTSISTFKPLKRVPLHIICNEISYRNNRGRMMYLAGSYVCELDSHVIYDAHFMY